MTPSNIHLLSGFFVHTTASGSMPAVDVVKRGGSGAVAGAGGNTGGGSIGNSSNNNKRVGILATKAELSLDWEKTIIDPLPVKRKSSRKKSKSSSTNTYNSPAANTTKESGKEGHGEGEAEADPLADTAGAEWVREVWKDLLCSELGYSRIPLVEVRPLRNTCHH